MSQRTIPTRFVITRLDQLKAIAEPVRVRIVEALTHRELTVAGLAERLGQPAGRLYHHVDLLLEAGLLVISRRVKKRGTEERWLRAVARDIGVDDQVFSFRPDGQPDLGALLAVVRSTLTSVADEVDAAAGNGAIDQTDPGRALRIEQQEIRLSASDYRDFCRRHDQLLDEARARARRGGPGYRLMAISFPLASPRPSSRRGAR